MSPFTTEGFNVGPFWFNAIRYPDGTASVLVTDADHQLIENIDGLFAAGVTDDELRAWAGLWLYGRAMQWIREAELLMRGCKTCLAPKLAA